MTLSAGARLGPYEILAPLGAGGMGEVYRARDTRLGREVAVKVLPPEVAADADRLRRFEKEARAASSLNHPNIVTIHEVERIDSTSFIVMELVDGKTLREVVSESAMPVRRLLAIAVQIAEGLARAHSAGIVHRDLKPENVMVTKGGLVKIMDFGLAKLAHPELEGGELTQGATVSGGTSPGVVMGTVGYMSPEQASGHPVDFRSDQFSFGSLLYEMATGKQPFKRATAAQSLAAIIQDEPEPVAVASPKVPPPLRWIIERCMAKEARERYASTEDLARDLAGVRDHLSEAPFSGESVGIARAPSRRRLGYAAAIAAVLALSAGVFTLGRRVGEKPIPTFQRLTFSRGAVGYARFAPDGQTVLYGGMWENDPMEVFSMRLGSREARSLASNAGLLAVSSSGEMALSTGWENRGPWNIGTLALAPLAGGAPRELAANVVDADWSPDGSALAVTRFLPERSANRLEFPLGKPLYESSSRIGQPRISPRGDLIAFLEHPDGDMPGSVAVVDRAGKKRTLSSGWSSAHGLAWSAARDEIWFTGSRGAMFDQGIYAVTLTGKERTVARWGGFWSLCDIARDGRVLAVRANPRMSLVGLPPGESAERDLSWFDISLVVDLSADGKTMLFLELESAGTKLITYLRATDGSPALRLGDGDPLALSPDASLALVIQGGGFQRQVQGGFQPRLVAIPTKAGEQRVLPRGAIKEYYGAVFFPDNKRILVQGREKDRFKTYIQELDGTPPRSFLPEGVLAAAVSPDGRRVAASFYERDGDQFPTALYVYSTDGGEPQQRFRLEKGFEPIRWSADGRSVFLCKMDRLIARVDRLDLATGKTGLWREIRVTDPAGVIRRMNTVCLTPDGKSYVYSVWRVLGDLYLIEGLR
jgi:eukaryotic-like serine/threonine-protein kinase